MRSAELVRICSVEEIPSGEVRAFTVEGYDIAVFNTGDEFFALENRCPHMGAPLSEGEIVDNCVCCHDHGWIIDLDTGEVVDREGEMAATFPLIIRDGEIYVQLS
jgi:nitrite reductase/ring-hydroxylating ferredoxin subunit